MGFSGRLEGIAPSDIFQIISQSRMTGTLIARCREGTAMVVFKNGQVIEAASDAQRESLGYLLVSRGLMNEEPIRAARERRRLEPDRPLGAILVEMGALSQQTLDSVVIRQIGNIVHRLMACDDGFFTFDSGENALKRKLNTREFFLPAGVNAEYLMMERVRALDEERRSGGDRRAHASAAPADAVPDREAFREARDAVRSAPPAAFQVVLAWLRTLRIPQAAEFMARMVRQAAVSGADLVRRHVEPRLRAALRKIRAYSPDGKAWMYAGGSGIAAGLALILFSVLAFSASDSDLVITGRVVNVRARPTTASTVVAKMSQGDVVSALSFAKGWHKVRTDTGTTGWIWKSLAEKRRHIVPGGLAVAGSGLVLSAGAAAMIVGILRRRKAAQDASHPSGRAA